ncbi:unnamed protein product [Amoebophrya sp. A120]|nr:unnamed protein product [Amoebophrya sp. A120]|eukprot:GSA120T00004124001.1
MMERCALDGAEGWMIDWSGVDWADEWRREADRLPPASQSYNGLAPTHLIVWDDPASGVTAIASKMSGWATTQDGESIRLIRLGRKKHVLEARNEFVCEKCGDILPDETALLFHQATGFCRPNKTVKELRTLRTCRLIEQKKKSKPKATKPQHARKLRYNGREVEAVPSFKYLGTEVAQDGTTDTEVARRCGIATGVVKQLQPIWRDRSLPPHLKAELYRSLSLSVVLYNAEAWSLSPAGDTALRKFQHNALRQILGGHYRNEDRSRAELCEELGVQLIEDEVQGKRIAWVAHAGRGDWKEGSVGRIEKEIHKNTPWGRQIKQDLEAFGLTLELIKEQKPTGIAIRATLNAKRKIQPKKRAKGQKAGQPKTTKRTAMEQERRQRLEQQRQEQEEKARETIAQISGKVWTKRPRPQSHEPDVRGRTRTPQPPVLCVSAASWSRGEKFSTRWFCYFRSLLPPGPAAASAKPRRGFFGSYSKDELHLRGRCKCSTRNKKRRHTTQMVLLLDMTVQKLPCLPLV